MFRNKSRTFSQIQHAILCSFPGIGVKKADKLLSFFKSLRAIFASNQDELESSGIGSKTAKHLYELLDLNFKKA